MLPTSGYFRGLGCPSHENGQCNRPYCHFHHSLNRETGRLEPQKDSNITPENDKSSENATAKAVSLSMEQSLDDESPSCSSKVDVSNITTSNLGNQSDLLQQLVSEAVKKVLTENPHLASVGVNPSLLMAQTSTSIGTVNSTKKKYYPRPSNMPSYNPTPIKELNKRKRSGDCQEESSSSSKVARYVPTASTPTKVISDALENKESGDSEVTDFSSPDDDDDVDKRNCDFDILEEVLAEHSKNNKIKVKKKKIKALGTLKYNMNRHDKKTDESAMISDAQTISDQDSNTCDGPKDKTKQVEETSETRSYFLPPSPVFTSSSDGFGTYNSVAYSKCENSDDEIISKAGKNGKANITESVHTPNESLTTKVSCVESSKNKVEKSDKVPNKKAVSTGHSLLPKVVQSFGAAKLPRSDLRTWTPQSRTTSKEGSSDPLEAVLQQMEGSQAIAAKDEETISPKTKHAPTVSSPKSSKKYKVDLDKEIKSLTSSGANGDKGEDVAEDSVIPSGDANEGKAANDKGKSSPTIDSSKSEVSVSKGKASKKQEKKVEQKESVKSDKRVTDENHSEKAHRESSEDDSKEEEEEEDKEEEEEVSASGSESEEKTRRRKKRKRERSSDSESEDSYRRKRRKKSRKRRKKYKKRKRRRGSSSYSSYSDEEPEKEKDDDDDDDEVDDKEKDKDEDNEGSKEQKDKDDDDSEGDSKVSSRKSRKHKKHRKKSKRRKKSKHRRSKKMKHRNRSRSQSLSHDSSRSTSRHRSRSSSEHRSRSRGRHRSKSRGRHRSRSSSRSRSRSRSDDRDRSRSRSRSDDRDRSRSVSKDRSRSRSHSREKSHGQRKGRKSRHALSRENENDQDKLDKESSSKSKNKSSDSQEKASSLSTPMPIDPSKIKVEKNADTSSVGVIVPDLSIVKKEKEDHSNVTVKKEKPDDQVTKVAGVANTKGDDKHESSAHRKKVDSHSEQSRTERRRSSDAHKRVSESESASHKKNADNSTRHSHRENKKSSEISKKSPEKAGEATKSSGDKERRKSDAERRSSSDSTTAKKSGRHSSTDSRKADKEHPPLKTVASERRTSSDAKHVKSTSSSQKGLQSSNLSMFDMVAASVKPPKKKKLLKEFSIFDSVSAVGYESSSDSTGLSDTDIPDIPDIPSENKEKSFDQSQSHNITNDLSSKEKKASSTSHSKPKEEHSHKSSSSSHSKSKSFKESDSSGKHGQPSSLSSSHSSTKHKSSNSHHDHSRSQKSSSKHSTDSKDVSRSSSSKTSHSSSSKTKETKHSSHDAKREVDHSTSKKSSSSGVDKEKEHSASHKNRDHKKKESGKEKEHSRRNSHSSRGKEKDEEESHSKKGKTSGRSHDKQKESNKTSTREERKKSTEKKSPKEDLQNEDATSSSDGELPGANFAEDEGCNSPFPDLSALDDIPQDDWEQLINSSTDDPKHLENAVSDDELDFDTFDKDDPGIMEECLKMYNEYKPDPTEVESQVSSKRKVVAEEESDIVSSKHRVARTSGVGNMIARKPGSESKARKRTPAQVMMERYQKMKEERAELLKQLEEQKQRLEEQSRSSISSSSPSKPKHSAVSSSSVSSTTPSRSKIAPASSSSVKSPHSTSGGSRRIAHTPNVASTSLGREKAKPVAAVNSKSLSSSSVASSKSLSSSSVASSSSTIAHTVSKGGKRLAHTPKLETLKRPTIAPEFGSKVPPNIRQRYLNSLIDECLKFMTEKDAYTLGLAEERVCFMRASSRMVYLNLAVNAVKRLRNQQEPSEAAQDLIDNDPMFKGDTLLETTSSSERPSTSGISSTSSPSNKPKEHPLNPNHSRLSHFSVLAVGGNKGSWSIEKPKKNTVDLKIHLKGANFYNHLKKYILAETQLEENCYPWPDPDEKGKAIIKGVDTRKKLSPNSVERYCDRCSVLYMVDKWGFPLSTGPCVHHWGRPYKRRGYSGWETRYSCCGGESESDGCCQATTHVSQNYNPKNLRGYVRTLPKEAKNDDYGVYALDCEMCYTTSGCELTRITVINTDGKTVYEQLVKPDNPIIDYNTRFSGITESDMEDVKTTIIDVQAALLAKFSDKTILIGHSLESDFHALKLIHDTVVDTSVVFPHRLGPPYKRALRNLASEYLKKIIQNDVSGHDSAEDALVCMELMHWRVKEDLKGFVQK